MALLKEKRKDTFLKRVILCGIVVIFAWWGASALWGSQTGIAGWAAISTLFYVDKVLAMLEGLVVK